MYLPLKDQLYWLKIRFRKFVFFLHEWIRSVARIGDLDVNAFLSVAVSFQIELSYSIGYLTSCVSHY